MTGAWPWLALAGLGVFHGLNPAMGWLFAVALGLHRRSRAVVLQSLVPLALGHALAIGLVAGLVVAVGLVADLSMLRTVGGAALLGWAALQLLGWPRHRARVGMQAGFAGLVLWSFLMAGAHGAGLMLTPALIPLCAAAGPGAGSVVATLGAVGVHTASMLAVTGLIGLVVYEWAGVGFLRRGWLNIDRLWIAALVATGAWLLLA